ncbi:unnamed protein product, partial [Owenia fusiformis]
ATLFSQEAASHNQDVTSPNLDVTSPNLDVKLHNRLKRSLKKELNKGWDVKTVPYYYDDTFSSSERSIIATAIEQWSGKTCLVFQLLQGPTAGTKYIHIHKLNTDVCSAKQSVQDKQELGLGSSCFKVSLIVRHIGFLLGFSNEQQRPDRDNHITLIPGNVDPTQLGQFEKLAWFKMQHFGIPYDLASIMHGSSVAFSNTSGSVTMVTVDPEKQGIMGQEVGVSFYDAKLINYKICARECPDYNTLDWSECQHGGYRNPENCPECLCPDGWEGDRCQSPMAPVNASCGGSVIAMFTPQYIESPGYGTTGYTKGQQCTWRITTLPGADEEILIDFVSPSSLHCPMVGGQKACVSDWLQVRFTDTVGNGPRYCCEFPTRQFVSQGTEVLVLFRSHLLTPGEVAAPNTGFRLSYKLRARVTPIPCKILQLSGISSHRASYMAGRYTLQPHTYNSRPVYRRFNTQEQIFYDGTFWKVALSYFSTGKIRVNDSVPVPELISAIWEVDGGGSWIQDDAVTLKCSSAPCEKILIANVESPGVYKLLPGLSNNRPAYKHLYDGIYLYSVTHLGRHHWIIGGILGHINQNIEAVVQSSVEDPVEITETWNSTVPDPVISCFEGIDVCDHILIRSTNYESTGAYDKNGAYKIDGHLVNGHPSYTLQDGTLTLSYVIKDDLDQFWTISPTPGEPGSSAEVTIRADTPDISPETITEWYLYTGGVAIPDNSITSDCIPARSWCSKIYIGYLDPTIPRKKYFGIFKIDYSSTLSGKYIYKHEDRSKFFYASSNRWFIGTTPGSTRQVIQFNDAAYYPEDIEQGA